MDLRRAVRSVLPPAACRLPPAALRVVLHADDKKTTTTSSCWLMRTHALKAHFLRTCSRSPEQQCQERQVEELQ
ncbi:hypothetical protein, partial [Xanthomonas oryzae]|uniref:hypothetical protein n=1 Tax=Xanthomonas oryzae TaxID=347 RepID=UPI001C4A4CAF